MSITSQLSTALTDRYRIERHLGEGGMATVYLAHDVKHDRKVALKVLRPELAAVIGAERFLNEIKVTANLQHPHILPLHDSGEAGSFLYYVMPYIEGDTLRDKLKRERQLAIEEAVEITRSIASALDYAHRQGVIHRDIKPENILLHDGQALVADFGIALAVSEASGKRLTETGLSIGTPHYMSPEQAMGDRELDARSDVYSVGAMLYEMLAGEPPYQGSSAQAIVAKVITEKAPPVTAARDTVPPHINAAIVKALNKMPADRFATAAAFADALTNTAFTTPSTVATPVQLVATGGRWDRTTIGLAVVAVAAVAIGAVGWLRSDAEPVRPVRFVITPPAGEQFNNVGGIDVAFAPDGSAFVYRGGEGGAALYMRKVDELEARAIPGTQGGSQPFFSPDGLWLGFYANGEMKKVPSVGGPALPVTVTSGFAGASWGSDDVIVYGGPDGTLRRVSAVGGESAILAVPDTAQGETSLRWPQVLPGGKHALVTLFNELVTARIGVVSIETGEITRLQETGVNPHYAPTGHLVYTRSDGSVVAVAFDPKRLTTSGQAFPVLGGVITGIGGAVEFALSPAGSIVYVPGAAAEGRKLVLVDRSGKETPLDDRPGAYGAPRFSPTGDRVAVPIDGHIWLYDVEQRTLEVRTFEGDNNQYPSWTPDGSAIVYSSGRTEGRGLYHVPADGSGPAELLHGGPNPIWESAISRDGKWLAYREAGPNTARDILVAALDGGTVQAPTPFVQTTFEERNPAIAPDVRWLAYTSDQSGRDEVYVRAFPQPGGQTQVSVNGGEDPVWSRDGSELFYRSPAGMMAARVVRSPSFRVVERTKLFDDARYGNAPNATDYDVDPRSGAFLMIAARDEVTSIVVVVNWLEELRSRR